MPSQWAFVPLISPAADPTLTQIAPTAQPTTTSSSNIRVGLPPAACPHSDCYVSDPSPSSTPVKHPMVTRNQDGTRQQWVRTNGTVKYPFPNALLAENSSSFEKPTCYTQAARTPKWREVMATKFNALLKNHTLTLVPPDPKQHVVHCKWVFKLKRKFDGSIERYKARLVAKGFHR